MPTGLKIPLLILAGAAAGMMNSLAGGGTLLTFPALMFSGMSAIAANITSTVALLTGHVSSMWSYRRELATQKKWTLRFAGPSMAGGLVGALLLLNTGEAQFRAIVPYLILLAAILFTFQGPVLRFFEIEAQAIERSAHGVALALLFQFGVAVYGGYFGAGIGILMLAALGVLGHTDIYAMNSVKITQAFIMNVVAVACFIAGSEVRWWEAALVGFGALVGGAIGPHFGRRLGARFVRGLVSFVGFSIGFYYLLT
jgi:uncharacterized membrane protein YfcA